MVQRGYETAGSGCSPSRSAGGEWVQLECSDGHSRPAWRRWYSLCWAPPQWRPQRRCHARAARSGHSGPLPLLERVRQTGLRSSGVPAVAEGPRECSGEAPQSGIECAQLPSVQVQRRGGQLLHRGHHAQSLPLPVVRWRWSLPEWSGRVKPANTERAGSVSLRVRAWCCAATAPWKTLRGTHRCGARM